jgi:hypothetical protein
LPGCLTAPNTARGSRHRLEVRDAEPLARSLFLVPEVLRSTPTRGDPSRPPPSFTTSRPSPDFGRLRVSLPMVRTPLSSPSSPLPPVQPNRTWSRLRRWRFGRQELHVRHKPKVEEAHAVLHLGS